MSEIIVKKPTLLPERMMNYMNLSKRAFVRICSFSIAGLAALLIRNCQLMMENYDRSLALENGYLRAVEDLSSAADNISVTLSKGIYSGTPEMLSSLSSKLWREAGTAKAALAQLPVEELQLENTYKFLSQVGNYALAISRKASDGQSLSDKEYENLKKLYQFSKDFSEDMWELENQVSTGEISLSQIISGSKTTTNEDPPTVSEGFTDFEEGFESYPTLIYDGPFSDHILEKDPEMLKGAAEVSQSDALLKAAKAAEVSEKSLSLSGEESGKTGSFIFGGDGVTVGVTKKGGFITYMLKSREVSGTSISQNEAINRAADYLQSLGIYNMQTTYYETYNNVTTVNFASKQDDVICYTDLIKIAVAMDNGEVTGFDARGYIVNHMKRSFPSAKISEPQAKKMLSPLLSVESSRLALIPSEGQNEVLCYEFTCRTDEDSRVLVYIGVETAAEEQILILFESEGGVLTM